MWNFVHFSFLSFFWHGFFWYSIFWFRFLLPQLFPDSPKFSLSLIRKQTYKITEKNNNRIRLNENKENKQMNKNPNKKPHEAQGDTEIHTFTYTQKI